MNLNMSNKSPDRSQSQASLPPLESPCLVSTSNRSNYSRATPTNDRHQILRLQEQIKSFQEDIQKKDKIIEQMSSLDLKICPERLLESTRSNSRNLCTEKEEVAALSVKIDNFKSLLVENSRDIEQKDHTIESLRRINSSLKEEVARLQVSVDHHRKQTEDFKDSREIFDTLKQRNDILIRSLEKQLKDHQEQLMQCRIENKELESQMFECQGGSDELRSQLDQLLDAINVLNVGEVSTLDDILQHMKTLQYEKQSSGTKVEAMAEQLRSRDCEQQAARQTITRLVAKLSAEETQHASCEDIIAGLRKEIEQQQQTRDGSDANVASLSCQLESARKELLLLSQDACVKDNRIHELTESLRQLGSHRGPKIDRLVENLTNILEDGFERPRSDGDLIDWIVGCVRSLIQQREEMSNMQETIESLKSELEGASSRTSAGQVDDADDRDVSRLKLTLDDLRQRLDSVNRELASAAIVIEGLNCDKTKYLRILTELAQAMKIDHINKDIGFDMITDALYARADQLQKLEYEAITEQRITEHGLQRKLKELRERLHSRDLHLDLLQRKLANVEADRHSAKSGTEKERDRELGANKKLSKLNQRQVEEIESLRAEVVGLKSQLIELNKTQALSITLEGQLRSVTGKLERADTMSQRQAKQLTELKLAQAGRNRELHSLREQKDNAISVLTEDLQQSRALLEESRRRETQMIELRAVISRLLGLDIDTLAIPDYEIVNRLERLVTAHQSNVYSAYSMDATLKDLNHGLYHEPCHLHTLKPCDQPVLPIYPKNQSPERKFQLN